MQITCTDFDLTESIKEKVDEFEDSLSPYLNRTSEIHITCSKESPSEFRIDIQTYAYGKTIRSQYQSHNFHKAFKLATDHFIESIIKAKDIMVDKRVKGTHLQMEQEVADS